MDLQATQHLREKRSAWSKVTVGLCFAVTVALLASSLFSPSRAHSHLRGTITSSQT